MNAPRWWMRIPELARRLLVMNLLGVLALSVVAGVLGSPRWFAVTALAPLTWVTFGFSSWIWVRSRSRMDAWERAKVEAHERDRLLALVRDRRAMRRD